MKIKMLCLWKIIEALETIWRQNEGLRMVVVVDQSSKSPLFDGGGNPWMTMNKWEIMELQLKRHMKDRQMTTLSWNSVGNSDTQLRSNESLEMVEELHFALK